MKNVNEICIVVQARLGSQRVPNKMIRKENILLE
jgi:spore coat polysaccharide biosynthesis protein SpsF (cytidylyltransferase family)